MRYGNDTKLFWRTGYKLFHGKFLRFMGGPKYEGNLLDGSGSSVDNRLEPVDAKINFAVPASKFLETSAVIKTEIKPGIIDDCLKTVAKHSKQVKVSFDSKKINGSLTHKKGDVDLFGCENAPTFAQLNERKMQELQILKDMAQKAELGTLTHTDIQNAVHLISVRIKELRQMACLKTEGVKKFKALGQPDWRTSKYVFVISSLQSSLFEIAATIQTSLKNTDQLCHLAAKLQGTDHLYCLGNGTLHMQDQNNYVCISSSKQETETTENPDITRCILRQRTPEWQDLRSSGKVTGSSAHRSMGLNSFKDQVTYYDQKFLGKEPPELAGTPEKFGVITICISLP
ncbi:hypothetical protein V1264_011760 [Littorina saxatilis]|uniref:Uncharacterized protein n=1 Tax=Littorina saxatilis TaxID=31220 RepID=A0AAN9BVF9_9CAEN